MIEHRLFSPYDVLTMMFLPCAKSFLISIRSSSEGATSVLDSSPKASYNFIHKTLQEFLTAWYVSSLPTSEQRVFVKDSLTKPNMAMAVRFMVPYQVPDIIREYGCLGRHCHFIGDY